MKKKRPPVTFPSSEQTQPPGLLARAEDVDAWEARCAAEDDVRLGRLREHYGILAGPHQWHDLALALAREFYPAPKKKGRTKWTQAVRMALTVEIERLIHPDDPARGAAWAAKQLAKRDPWRSFLGEKEDPAEVLRRAYFEYRADPWCRVAWDAFKHHEQQGAIAEWDALIRDIVKNTLRE